MSSRRGLWDRFWGQKLYWPHSALVYPVQSGYIQPVPSLGKRGGLGLGLTTPSHKKCNINIRERNIGGDGDDTSQGTGQMIDNNRTLHGIDTPTVDSLKPKKEMKKTSRTWGRLERPVLNRSQWHTLTKALCVSKHEEV